MIIQTYQFEYEHIFLQIYAYFSFEYKYILKIFNFKIYIVYLKLRMLISKLYKL